MKAHSPRRIGPRLRARTWGAVLLGTCLLAAARPAAADAILADFSFTGTNTFSPTLTYVGYYGQTSVYRADLTSYLLSHPGVLNITHVAVRDSNCEVGSDGVFSGFDLDFILFSRGSVFDGTTFGTIPQTLLQPGAKWPYESNYYVPTALHPGPFFGMTTSSTLDTATATLGVRDANFRQGVGFSVDTSRGWVTLGDRGALIGTVNGVTWNSTQRLYLYIGDADGNQTGGPLHNERATAYIQWAQAPPLGVEAGGPYVLDGTRFYELDPNHILPLILDGNCSTKGAGTAWAWSIDGNALPAYLIDSNTPWRVTLTSASLAYLEPNVPHTVRLDVWSPDGRTGSDTAPLVVPIPEPATAAVLCLGAAIWLRRRRK